MTRMKRASSAVACAALLAVAAGGFSSRGAGAYLRSGSTTTAASSLGENQRRWVLVDAHQALGYSADDESEPMAISSDGKYLVTLRWNAVTEPNGSFWRLGPGGLEQLQNASRVSSINKDGTAAGWTSQGTEGAYWPGSSTAAVPLPMASAAEAAGVVYAFGITDAGLIMGQIQPWFGEYQEGWSPNSLIRAWLPPYTSPAIDVIGPEPFYNPIHVSISRGGVIYARKEGVLSHQWPDPQGPPQAFAEIPLAMNAAGQRVLEIQQGSDIALGVRIENATSLTAPGERVFRLNDRVRLLDHDNDPATAPQEVPSPIFVGYQTSWSGGYIWEENAETGKWVRRNFNDVIIKDSSWEDPIPADITDNNVIMGLAAQAGKLRTFLAVPVELIDAKDGQLDNGDDVLIEPKTAVAQQKDGSIAWIEPHGAPNGTDPEMPWLCLRLPGLEHMETSVKWRLRIEYQRPNGNTVPEDKIWIPETGWITEPLDGAVEIYNNSLWQAALNDKGFFGGEAELVFQITRENGAPLCPEAQILFSIGGKKPDPVICKNYIDAAAAAADSRLVRLSYAVAKHESKDYNGTGSRYNQFWEDYGRRFNADHRNGDPLWCRAKGEVSAGGFGAFQITGNLSSQHADIPREQLWNWQCNADAYITIAKTGGSAAKGSVMDRFFAGVAATYPAVPEAQTHPTSYDYDGGTYDAWEMGTITLYNGALGCPVSLVKMPTGLAKKMKVPWTFDPARAAGARWQYHRNKNDYLHKVILQHAL